MSRFQFDCFVCDERLETNDIAAVLAFGDQHQDCGHGADQSGGDDR